MENSNPSITRREFAALSAATAGAVLGTGTAESRSFSAAETTDRYEFLVNHVEDDHAIPTLVTFTDESGFETLDDLSTEYRSHDSDPVAAYAKLVPEDAQTVVDAAETEGVEYAPGSNPFWKLEDYDQGVFLGPEDSVDFIGLEEALSGVEYLEEQHKDRLNVETIGNGAGHENVYEGTTDPREVWSLELTENVDDEEAVAEKETLVFVMSVHGDERAGVESGLRFVEEVLAGERPDIEELLSEFVLVFVSPNPGGWVVRQPVYEDTTQPPDFRRFNAAGLDPNRQYPVPGWILPNYAPGEPDGRNLVDDDEGVDEDVPEDIADKTPDTLSVVEHLRQYENVGYVLDLHGMYANSSAVASLTPPGGSPGAKADQELLNRALESNIESSLGSVDDWEDSFDAAIEDYEDQDACQVDWVCETPDRLFEYGTVLDQFGYTPPGAIDGWASAPRENGGLGATALTLEIAFSNSFQEGMTVGFVPELLRFHIAAYQTAIRTTIEHASDDVDAAVATDERSTAYVHSETVARSSDDLPHVGKESAGAVEGGIGTSSPLSGEYRHMTRVYTGSEYLDMGTTRFTASQEAPDPESVLGYQQHEYEVTPLSVFETLAEYTDAPVKSVAVDEVREEELVADGKPAYDNLVICHDDGIDEAYLSALTEYVDAGGNLVLTDAGVTVAAGLDVPGLESVDDDDITRLELQAPSYGEAVDDTHHLLADRKEFEADNVLTREPWNYPSLGYGRDQAPMYTVAESSLGEAVEIGISPNSQTRVATAPAQNDRVGVHLLGSLLPPAEQGNLHPFGLDDHALTRFGYQLLCNALGYRFDCSLNGEQEVTFGSIVDVEQTGDSEPEKTPTPENTATPEKTATPEPTPTSEDTATPTETETPEAADDDGPGFGPLAALAGAGGASYLLGKRLGDEAEQGEPVEE